MDPTATSCDPAIIIFDINEALGSDGLSLKEALPTLEESKTISRAKRFLRLLSDIEKAGLEVDGGYNQSILYLWVTCPKQRLDEEVKRARIKDWLNRVGPKRDPKEPISIESLNGATKIRLLNQILWAPIEQHGVDIKSYMPMEVTDIFYLHDKEHNREWIMNWSKKWLLKFEDFNAIRSIWGEEVAYYFAFLQFYFISLSIPTLLGLLTYYIDNNSISFCFSMSILLWSIAMIEVWRQREKQLSIYWDVQHCSHAPMRNRYFHAERKVVDAVTQESVDYFPRWKRIARKAFTIPIIILTIFIFASLQILIIVFQVYLTEMYSGPFHDILFYVPTVMYCACIPSLTSWYMNFAKKLNDYENYEMTKEYEDSLSQKFFIASFVTNFVSLFLVGLVYIPFYPQFSALLQEKFQMLVTNKGIVSLQRLQNEVRYYVVTGQFVNFLTEVVVPMITRGFKKGGEKVVETMKGKKKELKEGLLKKVIKQSQLPPYRIFEDYTEMVTQFGYVVMFSVVWPLTPLAAFINNWFELRTDTVKICINSRRPIPARADSIGPWLKDMAIFSLMGVFTNTIFICMFGSMEFGHWNSVWKGAVFVIVVEHLFFGARSVISDFVREWKTEADEIQRKNTFEMKKRYLNDL